MPRKYQSTEHLLKGDPRYGNKLVSKFINSVMNDGKKSTSQRLVYGAFDIMADRLKDKDPVEVFQQAISNVRPLIQVKSKRVGGATYQVPTEVSRKRAQMLAIRWILESARGKKGRPLARSLADELIAAYNGDGGAMTTRENVHKMAEANKAFSHFAW
ncbi:MAG: 30S ribosomal protein S7 [Planctomycetes bacterium]|nr:30S ribosomal protein S7 [Planctomycetota bacterium]